MIALDTSVFLLAAGPDHPRRDPCRAIVAALGSGRLTATITAAVVQELLDQTAGPQRAGVLQLAQRLRILVPSPLVIDGPILDLAVGLLRGNPRLSSRVAIHAACFRQAHIDEVVSTDAEFGLVSGLRRHAPEDISRRL